MRDPVQQRVLVALHRVRQSNATARDPTDDSGNAIPGRNLLRVQQHQGLYHSHVGGNSQRIRLDQHGLCQLTIAQLVQRNPLARQRLQDGTVVEALVAGVRIEVGQRLTVETRISQFDDNLKKRRGISD